MAGPAERVAVDLATETEGEVAGVEAGEFEGEAVAEEAGVCDGDGVAAELGRALDDSITPVDASTALDQASRWIMDIVVLKGHDNPELNARVNDLIAQIGEGKMAFLRENELKALGDRCVVPLARYLQSPRSQGELWKRQEAARVISDVAQPWCIPYLIELLDNPDGQVRAAAATALQRLTNKTQGRTPEQWRDQPKESDADTLKSWHAWWERNKDDYPGISRTAPPRSPDTQTKT